MRYTLALLLALLGVTGCTTADVALRSGPVISGKILEGDADTLLVDVGYDVAAIPRNDIADIDHPGFATTVVGASIIAVYAPLAIGGALTNAQSRDPYNAFMGQMLALSGLMGVSVGAIITGIGWWSGEASRRRATFTPQVTLDPSGAVHKGLSVQWEF